MTGTAPDVAGVVVGWRTWRVPDPAPARLRSPVKVSTEWSPGVPLVARCELRGHPAPEPLCTCGLYAAREPADVGGIGFGGATLLGCVAMWGTVVEGERGWRAGIGLPVVLFCGPALPEHVRAELAAAYGVPVHRLHRPVAVTVEQAGTGAAADRLRTVLHGAPPDLARVDDAARAFVDAVGGPPSPEPARGRGPRRVAVGAALLTAVVASALALPAARGADLAPAAPEPSATPSP